MKARKIKEAETDELKQMWDDWDNYLDDEELSPIEFHYDDIHAELNARGEGRFCAV